MAADLRTQLEADYFGNNVSRDLSRLVLGDALGSGQYRQVFEWLPDPSLVAKVEDGAGCFTNILEEQVWRRVRDTEFAEWFAPVVSISDTGILSLQRRTEPVSRCDLPKRVPAFFADLKLSNWGRFEGRVVCHDYGIHMMLEKGMTKRMVAAEWR